MKLTITPVKDISAKVMNVVRLGSPRLKAPIVYNDGVLTFQYDRPGYLKYTVQQFGIVAWTYARLIIDGDSVVIPEGGLVELDLTSLSLDDGTYTIFIATSDVDDRNESLVYEFDFTVVN